MAARAPSSLQTEHADDPGVSLSIDGKLGWIRLQRPPANALSIDMLDALHAAFDEASADDRIRVILLAAHGNVFCAGHDLRELTAHRSDPDAGVAFFEDVMRRCSIVMQTIVRSPKPVIAVVGGTATAAGCQLVASCDLAVASENASFQTPGVDIGLFCSTPMVALSRNLGRKQAMEMLLTGKGVPASRAREIGLINKVVPAPILETEAADYARMIAGKSSQTLQIGKEAFYAQAEMNLADAYLYASRVMVENMMTADAEEGIGAFLEKRMPHWRDR